MSKLNLWSQELSMIFIEAPFNRGFLFVGGWVDLMMFRYIISIMHSKKLVNEKPWVCYDVLLPNFTLNFREVLVLAQ